VFSAAYIAEEAEGDERSGDTTTLNICTLLGAILNISLRYGSFTYEGFSM
jgi:hypothetical protein